MSSFGESLRESTAVGCPECSVPGKKVKTLTLKSLLAPQALRVLQPAVQHYFCREPQCPVVYYGDHTVFVEAQVKVLVLQKHSLENPPACYCFGFSVREVLERGEQVVLEVMGHIQAGRCGCEVNNPQGSCCLGNVKALVEGGSGVSKGNSSQQKKAT